MIRKFVIVLLSVMAIAVLAACVVSHVKPWPKPSLIVPYQLKEARWEVMIKNGVLHVVHMRPGPSAPTAKTMKGLSYCYLKSIVLTGAVAGGVGVPLALIAGFCAFYPSLAFVRGPLRRRWRRKRNRCVSCGYALTGLPEPRCPECGTTIMLSSPTTSLSG